MRNNNHIIGRIGLVVGLLGSFSLVLMGSSTSVAGFFVALSLSLIGYVVFIVSGIA